MPRAKMSDEERKAKRRAARVRREARRAEALGGDVPPVGAPPCRHTFEETTQQTRTTPGGTFAIETCTRPDCGAVRNGRKIS